MKFKAPVIVIALSLLLPLFQNCTGVGFGSPQSNNSSNNGPNIHNDPPDDPPTGFLRTENFTAKTQERITQTDILFVIDESISMGSILQDIRAGFASLSAATYPADTRLAVTNMLPASYTDPLAFVADYTRPFLDRQGIFGQQPGFIRLVNGASIDAFLTVSPTSATNFPLRGCAETWFVPTAINTDGQPCLLAATQTALLGTGVEAGIVALDQLVRRQPGPLFRAGSLVNVIFISDTHDPGGEYYGRPGALPALMSYAQLQQNILSRNPGLRGLKLNGFVPLPPADHPALQGVKVVGQLPPTLNDSKISGEELHDFSYLPYIAASGGVGLHPVYNDWSSVLPLIIEESRVLRSPTLTLSRRAQRVTRVLVNGSEIDPSLYTLNSNGLEILLQAQPGWPEQIQVTVEYES